MKRLHIVLIASGSVLFITGITLLSVYFAVKSDPKETTTTSIPSINDALNNRMIANNLNKPTDEQETKKPESIETTKEQIISKTNLEKKEAETINSTTTSITTTTTTTITTTTTTTTEKIKKIFPRECGRNSLRKKRIINGRDSIENSQPWMVNLNLVGLKTNNNYKCAGVIISDEYIITSVTCLIKRKLINIHIGVTDLQNVKQENIFSASETFMNPNSTPNNISFSSNIAIVRLDKKLIFSNTIQPICLEKNMNADEIKDQMSVILGWGSQVGNNQSEGFPTKLQETDVVVNTSNSKCQNITYNSAFLYCVSNFINKSNACFGDGPLVYYKNSKWYMYGFFSFMIQHSNTCKQNYPTFFLKVTYFFKWISETTNTYFE